MNPAPSASPHPSCSPTPAWLEGLSWTPSSMSMASVYWGAQNWTPLLQMQPHKCQIGWKDHFSGPASYTCANTIQDVISLLCRECAFWLMLKTPRTFSADLFPRQLPPHFPSPACIVIPSQMQGFANKVRNDQLSYLQTQDCFLCG